MSTLRRLLMAHSMNPIRYPANATVWEVTIPEGGAEYGITCSATESAVINWGDGSLQEFNGYVRPVHSFAAGKYTLSITGGCISVQLASGAANYGKLVTKFVQYSNTLTAANAMFSNVTGLTILPGVPMPPTVKNMSYFAWKSAIVSVENGFILPVGLTDGNNMFRDCYDLINLPVSTMFDRLTGNINFNGAFRYCRSFSGVMPADKLWLNPNVSWTDTTDCFVGATSIENYNEIPAAWGGGGA